MKRLVLISVLTNLLVACGGGGGSASADATSNAQVSTFSTVSPPVIYSSSYDNLKKQNIPKLKIENPYQYTSAFAVGNFFSSGQTHVMLSKSRSLQCYTGSGVDPTCLGSAPTYIKDEHRAEFRFFKLNSDGTLVAEPTKTVIGCLTPRKAIVADFNKDGRPDIFVACTGWDAQVNGWWPFETNKLLINDGNGGFITSDVGVTDNNPDGLGYFHGVAAGDVNGDGYPDIVLTDNFRLPNKQVVLLINQKTNPVTFAVDNTKIVGQGVSPYFSVEMSDLDGDGNIDIIAAGSELPGVPGGASAETVILYGDGTGNFGIRKTIIPSVPGYPSPMDITIVEKSPSEKILYLARITQDYSSQAIQAYNLKTNTSSIVWTSNSMWVEWWLPTTRDGVMGITPYSTKNSDVFIPFQ